MGDNLDLSRIIKQRCAHVAALCNGLHGNIFLSCAWRFRRFFYYRTTGERRAQTTSSPLRSNSCVTTTLGAAPMQDNVTHRLSCCAISIAPHLPDSSPARKNAPAWRAGVALVAGWQAGHEGISCI